MEYSYIDFFNTLGNVEKKIAKSIYDYIVDNCPEYKPYNIKPLNNTENKWQMNFRKKPEFGKAFCSLYSVNGSLSIRVIGSAFMNYELFLRQHEFDEKVRNYILYNGFCENCGQKCYRQFREYWYINGELLASGCKKSDKSMDYTGIIDDYPAIHNVLEDDIKDIITLLKIQARHITKPQNPKEIRGGGYAEKCKERCGNVEIITLLQTELDIDDFEISDYCNEKRFDKYAAEYSLTPMGINDGFWVYHDVKAVCGKTVAAYSHTVIESGQYAFVTINFPFSFSIWGVWNYIAGWIRQNDMRIRPMNINGAKVPYIARFFCKNRNEYMTVYVPLV